MIGYIIHCAGVFIARGREDALVTLNIVPGETVYGEKKVSVDVVSLPGFKIHTHTHTPHHTHTHKQTQTHTHTARGRENRISSVESIS